MATKKINACLGIEILDNKMFCAALTKNKGVVFVKELPPSMIENGSLIYDKRTGPELKEILKQEGIKIKDCSLVLSEKSISTGSLEVGVMPTNALLKAIPLELSGEKGKGEIGPDFVYDFSITGIKRNNANEVTGMRILAIGADQDYLLDQKTIFKNAALNLYSSTCRVQALSNIVRYYRNLGDDLDNQDSFCFIEIGYTNTVVHFFSGCHYDVNSHLDYGVTHIEQAVARGLDISVEKAIEECNIPGRIDYMNIDAAVTIFNLLAKEIRGRITSFNASNFGYHLNEAICFGEGAKIASLINSIGRAVEDLIQVDTATNKLSQGMGISGEHFDECIVPIGAALQL